MHAQLEWLDHDRQPRSLLISDRVFIGRLCKGVTAERRVLLDDPEISRDHAVLTLRAHEVTIRDTSRNGTRVNGARLTGGIEYPLRHGDMLAVGSFTFTIRISEGVADEDTEDDLAETCTLAVHEVITHLVADVRGFSAMTQKIDSSLMYTVMRELFDQLSGVVHGFHGTVKDYAGDAIFAFWEHGPKCRVEPAVDACKAAIEQHAEAIRLMQELSKKYDALDHLELGWGIATGKVTLSHYGVRNDNVALIGDSTNLAFRLSGLANKTLSAPIVLCEQTARLVESGAGLTLADLGVVSTKGRRGGEHVYGFNP